jgi:cytosine deaminase
MDLILRNARVYGLEAAGTLDIGIAQGRIAALAPALAASAREIDLGGRLAAPPFVETHLHLDKACILDRCGAGTNTLAQAIAEVADLKRDFTVEDVQQRASRTLEKAIASGTMHVRTHVEVDPVIGLRGLEGVLRAAAAYRWALDVEICVFPQEGLTNNPGTEELMLAAMQRGATVLGAAPYTDPQPREQIERVFRMARELDADIDMHLDLGNSAEGMDLEHVCELTQRHRYGGRVAVGHVTKLTFLPPERLDAIARKAAASGVALTVLPGTDLYLMGRDRSHDHNRGVVRAHELLELGLNCSLSTNNVLNPFTPFGDCSLVRQANLYANVAHVGNRHDMRACFELVTVRPARLMRLRHYGIAVGNPADLVVLDAESPEQAIAELATPLFGFKRGRMTFSRRPAELHFPAS